MNAHLTSSHLYSQSVIDLVDPATQQLCSCDIDEAKRRILSEDPHAILGIEGSFALTAVEENPENGVIVKLARSLDRPMRYFLAKQVEGPYLIVAERIDEIRTHLEELGLGEQFHPSYTRMVPAHHVTTLQVIGCPDPQATYTRFFDPPHATLPVDLDAIGEAYVGALLDEVGSQLRSATADEPLGVLFSGGVDSGAVLLAVYRRLLDLGQSPSRLKAFTLSVAGGGEDLVQAREFLRRLDLEMLLEPIGVTADAVDPLRAVEVIEDYKPRDVECAAVVLALMEELRARYPGWLHLFDGDGGDENLKDYPIEENPELTIRSVVSNSMLYHEGWGVDALKHSLTYSGGLSRGCVRGYAPARKLGFQVSSPFMRPQVIQVAESIPFADLTDVVGTTGDHDKLYSLKGEIVRRGFRRLLDIDFPVFPKRRFQEGAVDATVGTERFGAPFLARGAERAFADRAVEMRYRRHFEALHI
ncbi:MAG: asparagine synthase-related protein [Thermoanaerobaculia bacterium]|nr:asparagine synthase-related protein [Thermoanaerobaculia bacterium]